MGVETARRLPKSVGSLLPTFGCSKHSTTLFPAPLTTMRLSPAFLALSSVMAATLLFTPATATYPACSTLASYTDTQLIDLYNSPAAKVILPTPGCYDGCVLPGHGTSGTQVHNNLESTLWAGKCFHADGSVANFMDKRNPVYSSSVVGVYKAGASVLPPYNSTVLIRYPDGVQTLAAAGLTGGFSGTGAHVLGDLLDEMKLVNINGESVYLGYTYVATPDQLKAGVKPSTALLFLLKRQEKTSAA